MVPHYEMRLYKLGQYPNFKLVDRLTLHLLPLYSFFYMASYIIRNLTKYRINHLLMHKTLYEHMACKVKSRNVYHTFPAWACSVDPSDMAHLALLEEARNSGMVGMVHFVIHYRRNIGCLVGAVLSFFPPWISLSASVCGVVQSLQGIFLVQSFLIESLERSAPTLLLPLLLRFGVMLVLCPVRCRQILSLKMWGLDYLLILQELS